MGTTRDHIVGNDTTSYGKINEAHMKYYQRIEQEENPVSDVNAVYDL